MKAIKKTVILKKKKKKKGVREKVGWFYNPIKRSD